MKEKELETCFICEGKGEYTDSFDDNFGNTKSFFVPFCESCKGTGKVKKTNKEELEEINKYIEEYINKENGVNKL